MTVQQPDRTERVVPLTFGRLARHEHGLVDDPVNGRVLVLGGTVRASRADWEDGTDVWAYRVATNTWTELVPVQPD